MAETEPKKVLPPESDDSAYQPPRIESVQSPEEVEHEVLYAGSGGTMRG